MKKLYGVTTAMVTPFGDDGAVDHAAIRAHTDFLIARGVHCLYPLGTTGEMYRLSVEERKAVAETVVKHAAGRVTVYIHVGAMTQPDTIALAQHAQAIGADGVGVVTPAFFGVTEREMEEYFVTVSKSLRADFPMYLYNIPQCAANDLKASVAQRITDRCENIVGIKYSYPDFLVVNQYLGINDGDYSVMVGTDRLFIAALALGCDGVISGVSSAYPEPFVAVYDAFQKGDLPAARAAQKLANQYCEILRSGANMSFFKEALKMRGIPAGHMRAPQLDLPEAEIAELGQALNRLNAVSGLG